MNSLIVITGQTATGKTKLALDYAKNPPAGGDGELINADSRQVYKSLDIVTGKDKEELKKSGIKVHLLDVVTPNQPFSSYDFVSLANFIIKDIWKRKKTPVIVGGTYLYIKHLLYGQDIKIPPNPNLRAKLEKKSVKELQKELLHYYIKMKSEPKLNNSDWNNPRRLIRKIEILHGPVKSIKSIRSKKSDSVSTEAVEERSGKIAVGEWGRIKIIGLRHKSRDSLVMAITERVEKRIKQGALDEVRHLLKMGYVKTNPGLQTIGYEQLISHLEGTLSLEEAVQDWINKEVQYAKRQYTFMKTDLNIGWETV